MEDTMGFFDFLNPKAKIEAILLEKGLGPIIERAKSLQGKTEADIRAELQRIAGETLREQADSVVPAPLKKYSDEMVAKITPKLVDKAYEAVRSRI
jgi:hypothetical protein